MASKKKAEDPNQPKTTPTKATAPKTAQPKAAQPKVAKPRKPAASKAGKPEGAAKPEAAPVEAKVETVKESKATAPRTDRKEAAASVPAPTGRVVVSREIGGRKLTLETGRMAKLSDGAVLATYGDTVVLATVNSAKAMDGIDFFPLTVDYRERPSAGGVIPGGFFKREGRPSTKEILVCRLIDRSIRPMFPDGFKREVQVLSQVLATDRENDPDVLTAIACFAALALSTLPHGRSLGMVRIGMLGDQLQVNPLWSAVQSAENNLNLTVAGHDEAIMMVEAGAKEVSEETMLRALEMAHGVIRTICGMVDEIVAKAGKPKMAYTPPQRDPALVEAIESQFGKMLRSAPIMPGTKQVRGAATKAAKEKACSAFPAPAGSTESQAKAWNANVAEIVGEIIKDGERQSILRGTRADGRDSKTVRPITIEVGVLPRVHGSVLFTRGETQALGVVTLGGTDDQQIIDSLMPEPRKRFMLHYNFPPFSVGEVKRVGTPGRREIGHGALAERGLEAVLPTREEFPYTIRITSEILESNGSSSMATACAGTLAMMDAGVAIKQPVAGIAMGLVMEGKKYAILTDILGSEDGCGDMDFKVVGTHNGITALQMDIKCDGLTRAIMAEALEQARQGRLHVLKEMQKALRAPRKELSPNAPRLESVKVPSEKIGLIIGPGGKNIRAMQETFECKISIEDGGMCTITGVNSEKVKAAVEHIKSMTAEVELGSVYEGRVTAIKEFGAFVEILPGQEGLVHVSELSDTFIRAVTDVVRIGDMLKVKVIAIDDFGKVKLSRKAILLAERGGEAPAAAPVATPPAAEAAPAREGRPMREDRPAREERPMREGAPERGDRPERGPRSDRFGDRPMREDRPAREERPMREDRPAREERPMGESRPPREERPMREDRPAREERPMREDRPARVERPMREERPMGDRPPREERPDRPMRTDRPERMDRPDRPERGPVDRPFRAEREDRPDRGPRPDRFGDRGDRGPRPERSGDRPDRPVRSERPEPTDRPDRSERDDRAPRGDRFADRGPRPDRFGPRPEGGERFDRPAREDRPVREDRPERSERPPAGDRFDRPVRPMTSDRPTRPEQGDRPERGFRSEGRDRDFSRDVRAPREEGAPRDVRAPREDRGPRPERAPEAAGERGGFRGGDRGPRDRGPRTDRAERAARGDRANLPMNEFGDAEESPPVAPVVAPATPVGQLESIDSVLGDDGADGGDRRRGPRRGGRRS